MKTLVVVKGSLTTDQIKILNEKFKKWAILNVPASGWTLEEIREIKDNLTISKGIESVVFITPIPALIASLSFSAGFDNGFAHNPNANHVSEAPATLIFHSGKIIDPFDL